MRSWPIVNQTSTDRFRDALARFREEQAAKATEAKPAKPKRKRTPKKVAA